MNQRPLVRRHAGTIGFGFLLAFLSSFGQTYFIALSVPGMQSTFGLSHGAVGTLFSVATLASGLLMIWIGAILDRVSIRAYAAASLAGLALAALGAALSAHVLALALAVFALRLTGQGMLSHAAVTSTAKLPPDVRGRAVGFASLGFHAGAALIPAAGIMAIGVLGWRSSWIAVAGLLLACLAIVAFAKGDAAKGDAAEGDAAKDEEARDEEAKDEPAKTGAAKAGASTSPGTPPASAGARRRVLKDWRFWILVPTMMGPAAISTGYFFHQAVLAQEKGWRLDLLALGITAFAIASAASSVLAGHLIDRFGSVRLTRVHLLPLALASLALTPDLGPLAPLVFFAFIGLTGGASQVVITTALAEMFGTARLGTVRALAGAIMVIASAMTPAMFGFAFDGGAGAGAVGIVCAAYLFLASGFNILLPGGARSVPRR